MNPTPQQLDWMRHGVHLLADRLAHPLGLSQTEFARLRRLLEARHRVLFRLETGKELDPPDRRVYAFMFTLANAHIAWYAGRISQTEFQTIAAQARAFLWQPPVGNQKPPGA